jgi:DNA-binding NarL/FixJ family response regulator
MQERIKIIMVDDHKMLIQGLKSTFKDFPEIAVIGECSNGKELLELLKHKQPDIVLLDIEMPDMDGDETLKVLSSRYPSIKVIIVSMHCGEVLLEEYVKKGARGFIPKDGDIAVLIQAMREVKNKGNCYDLSTILAKGKKPYCKPFLNPDNLSEREIEVLILTCKGRANKEIAHELNIVERTVELHKTHIYTKTNLKKVADLVLYGVKNGLC